MFRLAAIFRSDIRVAKTEQAETCRRYRYIKLISRKLVIIVAFDGPYPLIYSIIQYAIRRVSFCDGSLYDESLLRPLSSRTEHSRIVALVLLYKKSLLL
jgi:hypothetical protein